MSSDAPLVLPAQEEANAALGAGRERRLHPLSWLFVLLNSLREFAFPLIALLVFGSRGEGWEQWQWYGLIGAAVLTLLAVVRYYTYRFRIADGELVIRSGVLHRNVRHIPLQRIQNVALKRNVLHRAFGVAEVKLESAVGGLGPEAQMRVLSMRDAHALEVLVRAQGQAMLAGVDVEAEPDHGEVLLALAPRELVKLGMISNRGLLLGAAGVGVFSQFGGKAPVRIPLFFAMSGILAARAVRRSWSGLARTRIVDLLWPFLLWTTLIAPLWMLRLAESPGSSRGLAEVIGLLAGSVLLGGAHYWFLPALALFLIVGKLAVRVPRMALASSALIAFVLAPLAEPWLHAHVDALLAANITRWMELLFWFLLGCFGHALLGWVAARPISAAALGTAVFASLYVSGVVAVAPWLVPLLSISGVCALVGWSAIGARWQPLRRISRYLALRTLAIYLGHQFLLEACAAVIGLVRRGVPDLDLGVGVLMALFIPAAVFALVWASTAAYDGAVRGRLAWLYRPPARWKLPVVTAPM